MDLQEIRKQLDSIDAEFVRLFEKRMKLCADVAEFKIRTGKAVYDPKREQEKIAAVRSMAEGGFMKEAVGELFLQMMTLSRRYQYRLMEQVQSASDFGFQRVEDIEKKAGADRLPGAGGSLQPRGGDPVLRGAGRYVPRAPV